jgi:hypothetical protein
VNELPAPPDAAGDPEAVELLRAWIVGQTLQCSLQPDVFPDPAAWGAVLADVIRHVARAIQEQEGKPAAQTAAAILDALHQEVQSPPDDAGEVV